MYNLTSVTLKIRSWLLVSELIYTLMSVKQEAKFEDPSFNICEDTINIRLTCDRIFHPNFLPLCQFLSDQSQYDMFKMGFTSGNLFAKISCNPSNRIGGKLENHVKWTSTFKIPVISKVRGQSRSSSFLHCRLYIRQSKVSV